MNQLYKQTFDQVKMPENHARSLCAELASHCSDREREEKSMNRIIVRRSTPVLVAVILLIAMSVSALACGVYYAVTYEVNEDAVIPENAVGLNDQEADFEYDGYTYREEDGMIIVDMDKVDAEDEITYRVTDELPDGETIELTEEDMEFALDSYHYTEENGKVTVDLTGKTAD